MVLRGKPRKKHVLERRFQRLLPNVRGLDSSVQRMSEKGLDFEVGGSAAWDKGNGGEAYTEMNVFRH